jgi:hypothetical protein
MPPTISSPFPLPRRGYLTLRRPHRCAHRTSYTSLVMAPLSGTASSARQSTMSAHAAASSCSSRAPPWGSAVLPPPPTRPGSGSRSPPSSLNLPRSPPSSPPAGEQKVGNRKLGDFLWNSSLSLFQTQFGFLLNGTKWSEVREKRG